MQLGKRIFGKFNTGDKTLNRFMNMKTLIGNIIIKPSLQEYLLTRMLKMPM